MSRKIVASALLAGLVNCVAAPVQAEEGLPPPDFSGWVPGECRPVNGTFTYPFSFIKTISDLSENDSGKIYADAFTWNDRANYVGLCNCPAGWTPSPIYFKADSTLPVYRAEGSRTWYKITDQLAVSMKSFIFGVGNLDVPFTSPNTGAPETVCTGHNFISGSQGMLDLMIIKPFVGEVAIPSSTIFSVYAGTTSSSFGSIPMANVVLNGAITVKQSCEVNAGQSISVNFGDMYNGNFKRMGERVEGVERKTLNLGYKCYLVSSGMEVTMRFTGDADPGYNQALATSNPDIGVVIEDGNGNRIQPNTGTIPLVVDRDTQTGAVDIHTYPVSTTGKRPALGDFTSRATVLVEFQ